MVLALTLALGLGLGIDWSWNWKWNCKGNSDPHVTLGAAVERARCRASALSRWRRYRDALRACV